MIIDDEFVVIPPDTLTWNESTRKRVELSLNSCFRQKEMLDTFVVDNLTIYRLSSPSRKMLPCYAPIRNIDMPYFEDYLNNKVLSSDINLVCLPLCDGAHFQGYIVNKLTQTIVHVDSIKPNAARNPTSVKIAKKFFESEEFVTFKSLYSERVQFDSNTCGIWLIAGMSSYILG